MGHSWPGADWPQDDRHGPRHGRRPGGPPPWLGDILGFVGATQAPAPQRGPKVRRGDVRTAIIDDTTVPKRACTPTGRAR